MLFRPAESSNNIVDFYRNYLLTTFQTNNESYNRQLKEQLFSDDTIAKGPYISLSDSFAKDKSLKDLAEENIVCNELIRLTALKPERKLYKHQSEAIRKANEMKNLVITTGTGSGKTECFLIPVLNHLMKEKELGTLDKGVRTLIIYPMNALVNDQIRRIRDIFDEYDGEPQITFGKFTGETKDKYLDARNKFIELEGKEPRSNELISREQMRESPPNILITNYAMLEYLLLRPGDNVFFSEEYAPKWHSIVFDEAHTYGGAKGIEVATLIKRVNALLHRNDIQFMLTSATLGGENANLKVINFAQSLCNAKFDNDSIIRAYTTPPQVSEEIKKIDFSIYRSLSEMIHDNNCASVVLNFLMSNNISIVNGSDDKALEETLYYLILHDEFYHKLRKQLLNITKPLQQIAQDMQITINDLTDFITVASNAQLNGDKIFEARYHMFLRGLEGVFVTLQPSNKLFLTKRETYKENLFDETDCGYKSFEISFCHNCNAIFITGQTNENGYLEQKSKFSDDFQPEVYLLEGDYDEEDTDVNDDKSYLICAKCGAIKRANAIEGLDCGHGKENYNKLIKVKEKGSALHNCPCCHVINTQRSIIRPYFLGNEAATAVIATALYNELPNTKITKKVIQLKDDFFGTDSEKTIEEREEFVKQFITFSDNRQAAAFFASYLQLTYRDNLIKRLMTEVCENNSITMKEGISLPSFVAKLEELFTEHKIFDPDIRHKEAWITVAKEMINYKAKNSLQNKGILFFDIDIDMLENEVLNLDAEETTALFKILSTFFIKVAAIKLPISLTRSDEQRLTFSGITKGFDKTPSSKNYIESWLPAEGKENVRTKLLKKFFKDKGDDFIRRLLEAIWSTLIRNNIIKYNDNKYLLSVEAIKVKSVNKLYICSECKTITPYAIKGICTNQRCNGAFTEYDYSYKLKNDHYHNLFTNLKINDLIAKEHTAQLGVEKAYAYQNDFKKEKINVLSCSTTFEMGVDVGSLETVFMRNMPPSPANYAQRAGRAGRSLKSAAYALTFCPNNSHDLNYFKIPTSMIKGTIIPPAFNTNNEKIVLRHIFASAFSFFWQKYPELFKREIGAFFDANGYGEFEKYLNSCPPDLKDYLKNVLSLDMQICYGVDTFKWKDILFSDNPDFPGVFNIALRKYTSDYEELEKANRECTKRLPNVVLGSKEERELSNRIRSIGFSINTLKKQQLIEFLSRNNLIPKYGFPVDTVELKSLGKGGVLDSLRLDRDLFTAISEYAPESEVVADGKLITSRYVRVLNGYAWPKYNYVNCPACNSLNKTLWTEEKRKECKQCGHELPSLQSQYIIPKFGFIMENGEPRDVGTDKPERTYKGAISYIGDENKIDFENYEICNKKIIIGSSKMDELAVLNTSNFYICETCGYGNIQDDKCNDFVIEHTHQDPNGYNCPNNRLKPYSLGHEFQTDVVLLKFVSENITEINIAWTILYSLLEGLSRNLCIDRNELSGCLHWYRNTEFSGIGNYGFVLFDNTPGGAGYVRQLKDVTIFLKMLETGLNIVSNCTCGGKEADTACYSCLCNYYNQKQHDILKRKYAIDFFNSLLNGKINWSGKVLENEEPIIDSKSIKRTAVFSEDGQNQSSWSYESIWDYIMQDTDINEEIDFIKELSIKTHIGSFEKPFYNASIMLVDSMEKIIADLVWEKSKVLLFLSDNYQEAEKAKVSDWKVFCTNQFFDTESFIEAIKE